MREIGGFFELELSKKSEYHYNAIRLNTGRNALEYMLRAKAYEKVHLPYYICSSVLEPIHKLGIDYQYYKVDTEFNCSIDLDQLKENELLILVNYYGVCDNKISKILKKKKQNPKLTFDICIDNTQAFFAIFDKSAYAIYSARKFFGVPDGAYLYTDLVLEQSFEDDITYDKCNHLLKRIEMGPNIAYEDFIRESALHDNQPIKSMSKLSHRILQSIDYEKVMKARRKNFNYMDKHLKEYNQLKFDMDDITCPMVYPFYNDKITNLREYLISNKIYVAKYWKDVLDIISTEWDEFKLVNYMVPIPIDQRYDIVDMKYICDKIKEFI